MKQVPLIRLSGVLVLSLCVVAVGRGQAAKPDALARSGLVVAIDVKDAKGQPLVLDSGQTAEVRLWRKLGKWMYAHPAGFDSQRSQLVCGGYNDRGLEPCAYILKAVLGAYGPMEREFTVAAQGKPPAPHQYSTWRRVVTLRFKGPDGKPLAALDTPPRYRWEADKIEPPANEYLPDVLRKPPGGGLAFRRARGGASGVPKQRHLTDGGLWYLPVTAGREGQITGPVSIAGAFDDASFDKPVDVEYEVDLDAIAGRAAANEADPGSRSLKPGGGLIWPAYFAVPDSVFRVELSDPSIPLKFTTGWVESGKEGWTAAIPRDRALKYRFVSGPMFETPWKDLPKADSSGAIKVVFAQKPPSLSVEATGNTLRQWWDWCQPSIGPLKREEVVASMVGAERRALFMLDADRVMQLESAGEVDLYFGGADGEDPALGLSSIPWPSERHWLQTHVYSNEVKLSTAQLAELKAGKQVKLKVSFAGVILRAVNAAGAGVPHAQVSVLTVEDDKIAVRLKKTLEDAAAKSSPIKLEGKGSIAFKEDEEVTDDDLVSIMGDAAFKALGARDLRLRFARNGAWYDTHETATGDPHGYVLKSALRFEEGKKYVLYLWGGSRDDLKPDLRVEFTYTAKGVDLGARVVADYK
ncbi:MAG: hypothetical protein KF754_10935 [Planctomycetes bacterium]|nr:hypothetical protein [Planctomycetota bacterium]